ncbi:MAG TPA: heavy-metal-associated domain-containing protein, partial [Ilumatobacteraceae bacterium]|nr:heavy-metal-associated domain-containing protein [Ilumatobacteraceae bacterium]
MQRSVDHDDHDHADHGHDDDHGHHHHNDAADACCAGPASTARRDVLTLAPGTSATTYRVAELDCATEERELRDVLAPLDGVRDLAFDLVARRVTIAHTLA